MKKMFFIALVFVSGASKADMQWVVGDVTRLQEYAGYGGGQYEVLVNLENKDWFGGDGNGSSVCTERFRIKEGSEGVTADAKDRMFSLLLTYHMAGKRVALFVNTNSAPHCNVIATGVGDALP